MVCFIELRLDYIIAFSKIYYFSILLELDVKKQIIIFLPIESLDVHVQNI